MATVGVLLAAVGVLLCWEAWESHKNQTPPAPITHVTTVLSTLGKSPSNA